jgi:protein CsiD
MSYTIETHPGHARLYQLHLDRESLRRFLEAAADLTEQRLTYVPYLRLTAADSLQQAAGEDFGERINQIMRDRRSGGFTLSVEGGLDGMDQQVALGTAVTHLLGLPNFDDMSGNYYACFTVQDTDTSDSYLRQAYRAFTLHTDGTYVKEATDWILMMKMAEQHAVGGESRLLHLDDWEELTRFSQDPLASQPFTYRSPPSKNYPVALEKTTFYEKYGGPCVCFIDQFAYPDTLEQARYLRDLSASMEASPGVVSLPLPVDHLIVLNNHYWLHGREAFAKNPKLHRVLMRQRGYFRDQPSLASQ